MLNSILRFSIRNKLIVILFTLSIAGFGIYALMHIPVGAVPDITNNQVQVITTTGNLSTQDVEQFITYPVELEMANLPGVKEIRSISKFGLSVVTIVFEDNMGTYLPRQLIAEKIKTASASIPEGFGSPAMGPITTGLGEIYQYILDTKPGYEDQYTTMELRTIQDWYVKRQLSGIPGVVEINTWGGYLRQYEIAIDPERLKAFDISMTEVFEAVEKNNSVAGGAYIEKVNQSYFIRGEGLVKSIADIEAIVVKNIQGVPVLIGDFATVKDGYANRFGAITANGKGEKVLGQVMMLKDANSNQVIRDVKTRVAEIQKTLPEGVFVNPILERGELIGKTTFTVAENLILGCLIVIFVVVLLLGNIRSGLVIASLIPLSLLFTISLMYIFGVDANLMSLGAIDFGIIIDGAVIIVEYIALRMTRHKEEFVGVDREGRQAVFDKITFEGASRMMGSAIFGQLIILIVFIPILSLTGVEGKMFRPMALSFSFALIGAILLCMTWLPVAASLFLKPERDRKKNISEKIMNLLYRSYSPVIQWSYDHKRIILGMALASLLFTVFLFSRMGGEFVPTLDEGDFVIQPVLKTGTSLSRTVELTTQMENILIDKFPEVDQIVCRIGAAEVPTDPMSMEEIDMIIKLRPRKEWVNAKSKEELADKFKEALSVLPGIDYEFTQPIEMRFNELITGVRADVAVKIFGEDLDILNQKAFEVKRLIDGIEGAADVIVEKTAGLPQMSVVYNRQLIAKYGLNISEVNHYLTMGFGGIPAGNVFEGEKRFDLVVRLDSSRRKSIDDVRNLPIRLSNGTMIPLKELATIQFSEGPAKISRDNTHRRVVVSINVRNRDMESVVKDVRATLEKNLKLPPGYYIAYGGQFENLQNASARLKVAVPVALLIIFIFLHFAFKSIKEAAMVFSAIPLATVGGVLFLWIRGMPFSISAGVGFIALFGIAVLNGIVLIEHLKELKEKGVTDMKERILKGTRQRLRPVILTAASAALGFLPMAISTSAGAEVQRPLATVVIGGLITSTLLTMIALPLLYAIFDNISGIGFRPLRLKRFAGVLILVLVISSGVQAQQKEIKLSEAIDIALAHNQDLKSAKMLVKEAEALVPSSFSIEKTRFFYGMDKNNVAENGLPLEVMGVEQNFAFPGTYLARRSENKVRVSLAGLEAENSKLSLVKEVSQQYLKVVFLLNKKQLLEKLDSLYLHYSNQTERRYEEGQITILALLNARASYDQVRIRQTEIRTELLAANRNLAALLQSDSLYTVALQPLPRLKPDTESQTGANILAYYAAQSRYQKALVRVEKNAFFPDFSFTWFRGTNTGTDAEIYPGYEVGLSIPLFFNERMAKLKASRYSEKASLAKEESAKVQIAARRAELLSQIEKTNELLLYYDTRGKILADEIFRVAGKSYNSGEISYFEWIKSIETALEIESAMLENTASLNTLVLELNYLTF